MSLKTCHRMLMAEHVDMVVYVKGQSLMRKRKPRQKPPLTVSPAADGTLTPPKEPARQVSQRSRSAPRKPPPPRFLEPVPGVGEYDLHKYSDFAVSEPRPRVQPTVPCKTEFPSHNHAPVGAYDVPPPPRITRNWSFGKPGKEVGRPVPMEVLFSSSHALPLATVRHSPAPHTYALRISKDTRMGVFTVDKRDKEKKLKEPAIGPGYYMKDNDFIKSQRSALLNVVGRVLPELPFRRKTQAACARLAQAEKRQPEWNHTTSAWSTSSKTGIFESDDSGPGFAYGRLHTWFPKEKIKSVTTMRPVTAQERFAVHRMRHLSDRIWGPF